jgi:hypothetical protein
MEVSTIREEMTLTISGKQFGKGKVLFPNWQMSLPAGTDLTLRELIIAVVQHEVAGFRERQEQRQVLRALSAAQIAEGVAKGKVDAGGRPETITEMDEATAVANAIQAFDDGLYYVFVDSQQRTALDAPVRVRNGSEMMFLRLVALVGG